MMNYPWLQTHNQRFIELHEQDHLPHAILLSGKDGLGKLAFAKGCARTLLAVDDKNASLFDSTDGHPDLHILEPEGKMEILKIDQIRAVTQTLSQTAQQGGYRVVIVNRAESLNQSAANALLKSLEEPGAKTLFFLLTDAPHLLLPTIHSRCQEWVLAARLDEATRDWMQQQCQGEESIETLWALSEGAPLKAQYLANSEQLKLRADFLQSLLGKCDPIKLAQTYSKTALSDVLHWLTCVVTDLIKLKHGTTRAMINIDQQAKLQPLASRFDLTRLMSYLDLCYQRRQDLNKKIAVNPQLFLEELLLSWQAVR